ncbi:hypothetical protein [Fischerella sp. PCC 9605]|uniref:hypothetical protein n=1 Tax=Fischerella sp. PCC 9605 TaxID=1173024 RepID=UPI0012DDDE22|nr:hypothetical protein [Fischerella sp. PCC 9605]
MLASIFTLRAIATNKPKLAGENNAKYAATNIECDSVSTCSPPFGIDIFILIVLREILAIAHN